MNKWEEALSGKSASEAFTIIWNPKRDLSTAQRKALFDLWKELNVKKYDEKYTDPTWWGETDGLADEVQQHLDDL